MCMFVTKIVILIDCLIYYILKILSICLIVVTNYIILFFLKNTDHSKIFTTEKTTTSFLYTKKPPCTPMPSQSSKYT